MTSSLIASAMMRDPLYHIECLTVPSYTKYLISSVLEQLAHQPQRRASVASGLDKHVENLALVIHCMPQIHLLTGDAHHHLVQVPTIRSAEGVAGAAAARSRVRILVPS